MVRSAVRSAVGAVQAKRTRRKVVGRLQAVARCAENQSVPLEARKNAKFTLLTVEKTTYLAAIENNLDPSFPGSCLFLRLVEPRLAVGNGG